MQNEESMRACTIQILQSKHNLFIALYVQVQWMYALGYALRNI